MGEKIQVCSQIFDKKDIAAALDPDNPNVVATRNFLIMHGVIVNNIAFHPETHEVIAVRKKTKIKGTDQEVYIIIKN